MTHSAQLGLQMPIRSPPSYAQGEQRARQSVDVVIQLGVAPATGIRARSRGRLNHCIVERKPFHLPLKVHANSFLEQRDVSVASGI